MEKFLKVVLRILIIVLAIILIIISCVFAKNLIIFGTIRSKGKKILKSDNYKITITSSIPDYDYAVREEIMRKDDIQVVYTYNHDELNGVIWKNDSTDEKMGYAMTLQGNFETGYSSELVDKVESMITLKEFSLFKNCVSNVVETKEGCYVFKAGKNYELYFDQFSGELVKTIIYNDDLETINMLTEYKFELDKVIDENVKKPIL